MTNTKARKADAGHPNERHLKAEAARLGWQDKSTVAGRVRLTRDGAVVGVVFAANGRLREAYIVRADDSTSQIGYHSKGQLTVVWGWLDEPFGTAS